MATATTPDDKTQEDNNPGQDEFDKLIDKNFSPGDETAMEERAKDGAIDDNSPAKGQSSGGEEAGGAENNSATEEKEKITEHENQLGSGYKPDAPKNDSKPRGRWPLSRRQTTAGGGVVGTIIAIVFGVSVFQGPLEFVHIAQLLQQFHFSSQQDMTDDRFTKIARYIRYKSSGQVEKTRLGFFQNKIADRIESHMNDVGIKSSYSSTFGFGDGYVIDPEKLAKNTEFSDLKGKNQAEIEKYFKDNFNVDVKTSLPNGRAVPKGSFFVDANAAKLGYFQNRKIVSAMMTAAGYNAKTGAVGSRIMGKRTGSTWHPIEAFKNSKLSDAERKSAFRREQVAYSEKGAAATVDTANDANPKDKAATDTASTEQNAAQQALSDGQQANSDLSSGDNAAYDKLKASLSNKFTLGGLTATGVLCIFSGLDLRADQIKESQVVLPLVRQGVQAVSLGNQVMSGRDLDTTDLGDFKDFLNGKSSDGRQTSWIQAESIQAELGRPTAGTTKPAKTLTTINNQSPFHFLNEGALGPAFKAVCSPAGSLIQITIGFLGGGIAEQLVTGAVQSIVAGPLLDEAAHWLAGTAANPLPAGADFGNAVNFGTRLAANSQAVSEGGRKLSDNESSTLTAFETRQSQKEFQSHNVAYQLFNPYDYRSATAKLIDQQSLQPSKMASGLFNFGHIFANLSSVFAPKAQAAGTGYDYGFPKYGFSMDEMNDPSVQNPFKNADEVVNTILPAHPDYTEKADKCFGVTIDAASYDVSSLGTNPIDTSTPDPSQQNFYTNSDTDCSISPNTALNTTKKQGIITAAAPSNTNCANVRSDACDWMKVRFYVYDSQAITSAACYLGNDGDADTQQACNDVGFDDGQTGNDSSTTDTGGGAAPTGSAQNIAKQILQAAKDGRIKFNILNQHDVSDRSTPEQNIQDTADGKPAHTTTTCASLSRGAQPPSPTVNLDTDLLKFILELSQAESYQINAIAGQCHGETTSNHYQGKAVDIGCPFDPSKADQIGSKYNISDQTGETCSGTHYHYSIGGH
jgi:hypothetical protein